MYRIIFKNTVISCLSFFCSGLISILIAALVIRSYGITDYGFIISSRILLPNAFMAIFDFGFSEISTQINAKKTICLTRSLDMELAFNTFFSLIVGVLAGALIFIFSVNITTWIRISQVDRSYFIVILEATALCMPLFFVSLSFEGILKGEERFDYLRLIELLTTFAYAVSVIVIIHAGFSKLYICYVYLVSLSFKSILIIISSWGYLNFRFNTLKNIVNLNLNWLRGQYIAFFGNKLLGVAQGQLAPVLVSIYLGQSSIGIYDLLNRIPRAIKGVQGIFNSTILPSVVKFEAASDSRKLSRFCDVGLLIIALLNFPIIGALMTFSSSILDVWVGYQFNSLWFWQALLFLIPALNSLIGFGSTIILVKSEAAMSMNRLITFQILIQFSVACMLVKFLDERAFFLGQILAVTFTAFSQFKLLHKSVMCSSDTYLSVIRVFCIVASCSMIKYLSDVNISNISDLFLWMSFWLFGCSVLSIFFGITRFQRALLIESFFKKRYQ